MHVAEHQSDDADVDSTENPLSTPSGGGGYRPEDWESQGGGLANQHSEPASAAPISAGGLPRATAGRSAVTMAPVEDEDTV